MFGIHQGTEMCARSCWPTGVQALHMYTLNLGEGLRLHPSGTVAQ